MEKFVNEVTAKLMTKFSCEDVVKIREIFYSTLKDYDLVPKKNDIAIVNEEYPRELTIYLASRKIDGLRDKTLKNYRIEIEKLLLFLHKPIKEINTEDLRLYYYEIQKSRNISNVTLNTTRRYINAFFTWLHDNEYIDRNPCAPIKPVKCEKKIKKALTDLEIEKLRMACKNNFERAVIEVLYATACRASELVNIKISDINFDTKEVNIIQGKGNKSRISYLNAKAVIAIQEYLKDRDWETVYLFEATKKPHNHVSIRWIEKTCRDLQDRTGIRIHPHKMRRTAATNLWKKGMPV